MNPAWSVNFLTTLAGAAQGLFLALFAVEHAGFAGRGGQGFGFFATGGLAACLCAAGGLLAPSFHLGRPAREGRSAALWRTPWLARAVIVLALFLAGAALWMLGHLVGAWPTRALGAATSLAAVALSVCLVMIYASVPSVREWAGAFTPLNLALVGLASGALFAAALAGFRAPALVEPMGHAAVALTLAALVMRVVSLWHLGRTAGAPVRVNQFFIAAGFLVPALLVALVLWVGFRERGNQWLLALAFTTQCFGLLAERWFLFAEADRAQHRHDRAAS